MSIKLLIIQGRPQGKGLLFPEGEYVFGRGDECHVRPNSDWVSRQHCLLRVTSNSCFLRDLGSRNGTLVNGVRLIEECTLRNGDQVQIGPLVFEVRRDDAAEPHLLGESVRDKPPRTGDTLVGALDTAEMAAMDSIPESIFNEAEQTAPVSPPS